MSSCAGLGEGATDTASYKFTLAALNTTLPNIEAPLVLGWSASEGDEEASDWAMSVSLACFRMSVSKCIVNPRCADPSRVGLRA